MTNSETEMCMWKFHKDYLEAASLEDRKCTTLRVRSSGSAFCRTYLNTKEGP